MSVSAAINRALSLPCWKAPTNARPLDGGITNVNIRLSDKGQDYVVRLGDDIPEHGVMRFNELAISRAAHLAGLSPRVHYHEAGVLVLEFVDALPLSESQVREPLMMERIVDMIAKTHRGLAQHIRGPVLTFWVFQVLRDYVGTLTERGSKHLPLLPSFMDKAARLEAAIGPIDLMLGHNDLLPANILQGADRLWLIDWEYGGFNSPLFDLGGLAANCGFDEELEIQMLGAYFETAPNAALLHRYHAMKCASLLREVMWSMVSEITSKIDFDYSGYTRENMTRFERSYQDWNAA